MQLRKHVPLLSWTLGDKLLFLGYGIITWLQIRALAPEEYALAAQLITLQAWIAIVAEGSILQSIIQYGQTAQHRPHSNFLAFVLHTVFTLGCAGLVWVLSSPLSAVFREPRFCDVARILPVLCLVGIPRSYALKLLQRELRARDVFTINVAWLGSMTVLTIILLATERLRTFEDMATIALVGMTIGSVVGCALSRDLFEWSLSGAVNLATIIRFSFPQALMMILSTSIRQLDIFLVQAFFTTRAAGIYNAAKMLYRVFETGSDAVLWLTYPTAVRFLYEQRKATLGQLIAKALVVQWIIAFSAVLLLEVGITQFLVGVLGARYDQTAIVFNIMALGALFLPLTMAQAVLLALHRTGYLLVSTAVALVCATVMYSIIGILGELSLVGLGVVVYSAVIGFLLWLALRSEGIISTKMLLEEVGGVGVLVRSGAARLRAKLTTPSN